MSGYKKATIVLREDEFLRLHDAEMELLFAKKDLEREKRKQAALRKEVEASLNDIEMRQQAYRSEIAALNDQVAFTEAQNQALLADNRAEMLAALREISSGVAQSQAALLENQEELLQMQLEREAELRQEISAYLQEQTQIANLKDRERVHLVGDWMAAFDQLERFLQNHYLLETDDLEIVEKTHATLVNLTDTFISLNPDAALVIAMQAYQELSSLRSRLEKRQLETSLLKATLRSELQELIHLFDEYRLIPAIDLQGKLTATHIDVDFWTAGTYSLARQECVHLLRALDGNDPQIHRRELAKLMDEFLPAQQQRLTELLHQARMEVLRSQLRVETARALVQALAEQGYKLGETGYLSGDQRNSYSLRLVHPTGDDIDIMISPHEMDDLANVLQIASHPHEPITNHEMLGRIREIKTSLSRHGLLARDFVATATSPATERELAPDVNCRERKLSREKVE